MTAVAVGGLLTLIAVGVVLLFRPGPTPTTGERADALARELRCPDCQGLSVADSPTGSAQEIRRQIDALLAGGASADEVRAHFVARYGEWILLAPASPLAWIIPFAVVLAGAGGLGAWLMTRRPAPSRPQDISPGERQRLREEAEALDA
ncbi:MAG: cytochrome c-type biogenesis protein [Candidatus Limnocylindria bacterium]